MKHFGKYFVKKNPSQTKAINGALIFKKSLIDFNIIVQLLAY